MLQDVVSCHRSYHAEATVGSIARGCLTYRLVHTAQDHLIGLVQALRGLAKHKFLVGATTCVKHSFYGSVLKGENGCATEDEAVVMVNQAVPI